MTATTTATTLTTITTTTTCNCLFNQSNFGDLLDVRPSPLKANLWELQQGFLDWMPFLSLTNSIKVLDGQQPLLATLPSTAITTKTSWLNLNQPTSLDLLHNSTEKKTILV